MILKPFQAKHFLRFADAVFLESLEIGERQLSVYSKYSVMLRETLEKLFTEKDGGV